METKEWYETESDEYYAHQNNHSNHFRNKKRIYHSKTPQQTFKNTHYQPRPHYPRSSRHTYHGNHHTKTKQSSYNKSNNMYNHQRHRSQRNTNSATKTWIIKSHTVQIERNTSHGPILYCPPTANKTGDIITIKHNDLIPLKPKDCIRIIALGCTHELHSNVFLPNGDLLIHAGDICNWRRYDHTQQMYRTPHDTWKHFVASLDQVRKRKKGNFRYGMFVIPGNHDGYAKQNPNKINTLLHDNDITLLVNQSKTIHASPSDPSQLVLFGSPISWYRGKPSNAYQIHRKQYKHLWNKDQRAECDKYWDDEYIRKYFKKSDIAVTHGPPFGFGDCRHEMRNGSYALLDYIKQKRPKLLICCDYHGSGTGTHGYGIYFYYFDRSKRDSFCIVMNVAICHCPARYMRLNNIERGVTVIDTKIQDLFSSNIVK
eukprot:354448_1